MSRGQVGGRKSGGWSKTWLVGQVHRDYPDTSVRYANCFSNRRLRKENKEVVPEEGKFYKCPRCPEGGCQLTSAGAIVLSCHKVAMSKDTLL